MSSTQPGSPTRFPKIRCSRPIRVFQDKCRRPKRLLGKRTTAGYAPPHPAFAGGDVQNLSYSSSSYIRQHLFIDVYHDSVSTCRVALASRLCMSFTCRENGHAGYVFYTHVFTFTSGYLRFLARRRNKLEAPCNAEHARNKIQKNTRKKKKCQQ